MTEIPFEALEGADLVVGAVYRGGPGTKTGDDSSSRLLPVDNQGGFRKSGDWRIYARKTVSWTQVGTNRKELQ